MERSEAAAGGENTYLPVRTRFVDGVVLARATDQVVLLGAGLDTRPHRLPIDPMLRWYEIDRAGLLAEKAAVLDRAGAVAGCALVRVPADLGLGWLDDLAAAGWRASVPTLWVAEGLFYHLPAAAVSALLTVTAGASAPGSALVADVMGAAGPAGPGLDAYRRHAASGGLPPPFGHDDPAALGEAAGWPVTTLTWAGGPDADYGRTPPVPPGPPGLRANLIVASR